MTVILLANGPSLASVDMSKLAYPAIGMNRSWKLNPNPAFHVALEAIHYKANPEYHEKMAAKRALFVAGSGWPCGRVMPFASGTFSKDISQGVVTELGGVGSVFFAALQVAWSLGFRKVYALGLDLAGPHFDDTPASAQVERQNELFAHVPTQMQVLTAGSPESRAIFPKADLSEVYEPAS